MPTIQVRGTTVHYADIGKGEPVLLVHAANNHGGQWDPVRADMGDGYRYLLPDLFNCGRTGPWPFRRDLDFDDETDIVLAVLGASGQAAHIVGHSYGGAVALRAAIRSRSQIRSMCLIEPGGCPLLAAAGLQSEYDEYVGVMQAFLTAVDNEDRVGAWRSFLNYYRGSLDAWDQIDDDTRLKIIEKTDTQRQVYAAQMSNPTTLAEVRKLEVETLIVTGSKTTAPERGVCGVLAQYLPNASVHTIQGAGHPMPTTHSGMVASAVASHIRSWPG
jgi:pimeloyl-ACP methyl ester carboxylesterase